MLINILPVRLSLLGKSYKRYFKDLYLYLLYKFTTKNALFLRCTYFRMMGEYLKNRYHFDYSPNAIYCLLLNLGHQTLHMLIFTHIPLLFFKHRMIHVCTRIHQSYKCKRKLNWVWMKLENVKLLSDNLRYKTLVRSRKFSKRTCSGSTKLQKVYILQK